MISNSFIILPGISNGKEKLIWSQGIKGWDDFLSTSNIKGISQNLLQSFVI